MKRIINLSLLILLASNLLHAQPATDKKHLNIESNNLAMEGYDPVAYFTAKQAIQGKATFAVVDGGITYRFSSETNKKLFLESPAQYKPQYGGWCAYAMGAKGEKVEVDPETFKIVAGKLYLFYNKFFNNTLDTWNENEAQLKANADKNWSNLLKR